MRQTEIHKTSQKIQSSKEKLTNSINALRHNISNRLKVIADLRPSELPHINWSRYGSNCRIFQLIDDHDYNDIYAVLSDAWINTPYKNLMPVNIYGHFQELIDNNEETYVVISISQKVPGNYIVLYPDRCLAVTMLKESSNCDRKTYLRYLYSTMARQNSIAATKGTIYHNVFELVLLGHIDLNDEGKTADLVSQQILREASFFITQEDETNLKNLQEEMLQAVRAAFRFKNKYMLNKSAIDHKDSKIIIESLVDTEYAFNSHNFGFSGKVDVLFKCKYYPNKNLKGSTDIYVPFELKTGRIKDHIFYNDQAMIYNFCLHDEATKDGLSMVYYSIDDEINVVENDFKAFGNAIRGRNYTAFVIYDDNPPKVLRDKHMCTNCIHNNSCTMEYVKDKYNNNELEFKPVNNGQTMLRSINDLSISNSKRKGQLQRDIREESKTKKRNVVEMMITEGDDDVATKKQRPKVSYDDDELLMFMDEVSNQDTMANTQAQELHDFNADVDIEDLLKVKVGIEDKIRDLAGKGKLRYRNLRYLSQSLRSIADDEAYKKSLKAGSNTTNPNSYIFSFSNLQTLIRLIQCNDLKDDVKIVTPEIEVRINRTTRNDIDDVLNDFHRGKVIVLYNSAIFHLRLEGKIKERYVHQYQSFCVLRILLETDRQVFEGFVKEFNGANNSKYYGNWQMVKDERSYYPLMRLNIAHLFTYDGYENLIRVLLRKADEPVGNTLSQNTDEVECIRALGIRLNDEQVQAVLSCLLTKYIWMVNGYSGTGKKQVVVALLKSLLTKGLKALLVTNSPSTMNKVLSLLSEYLTDEQKTAVVRMMGGNHANSFGFPMFNGTSCQTLTEMLEYNQKTIFCTTLQTLGKCRFTDNNFEYVIVAEASDISEPMILQALYLGRKIMLIGDCCSNTLSIDSESGYLNKSLFDRLYSKYPTSVSEITTQFKHNQEISRFLNSLVYGSKLKDNNTIGNLSLDINVISPQPSWLTKLVSHGLVLLNTEGLISKRTDFRFEYSTDISITRHSAVMRTEIERTIEIYKHYIDLGIDHSEVLVVVEDYSQQATIKDAIEKVDVCLMSNVKGRTKDIVLMVLCLDGLGFSHSETARLRDQIKYVVARARKQVVIVINLENIRDNSNLKDLVNAFKNMGVVIDVKKEEIAAYIDSCPF